MRPTAILLQGWTSICSRMPSCRSASCLEVALHRLWIALALLVASTLSASSQAPQSVQQPTFRGGTTLVQVDAIVADVDGRPVTDLTVADFDILDDGRRVAID